MRVSRTSHPPDPLVWYDWGPDANSMHPACTRPIATNILGGRRQDMSVALKTASPTRAFDEVATQCRPGAFIPLFAAAAVGATPTQP